jgi:iron complex transport system permease protein
MNNTHRLSILGVLALLFIALYLFTDVGPYWDYVLPRRAKQVIAIVLVGTSIAFSTVVFQTITNNRILTPSIIGLDALYMLIQTVIVFVFGSLTLVTMNPNVHFILSVGLMIVFASLLFKFLLQREGNNIYFLLLVGIIFGTFFSSITSFMEMIIDPNEFVVIQDKSFASFNNINDDLLTISIVSLFAISLYFLRFTKYLDVLALGRDHALNLGVPYDQVVRQLLFIVVVLISISTALVGPITFLGLLVANIAYQFVRSHKHGVIIPAAILISIASLACAQLLVVRVFTFSTTISVIINFLGGVYFIYLLLKESKSW